MRFVADYAAFLALGTTLLVAVLAVAWSGASLAAVDHAAPAADFSKGTCTVVAVKHSARVQARQNSASECFDDYTYTYTSAEAAPHKTLRSKTERRKRKDIPTVFQDGFSWYPCEDDDSDVVPARWKVGDKAECWVPAVSGSIPGETWFGMSVYECPNDECVKIARSPERSLDNSQTTATWCLWAFSALTLALVAVMIWVCVYHPPRQGPLDYLPIGEGQGGEAGQTEASEREKYDQHIDPALGTVPRTVNRERSWTETSDHSTLRREISESFSDISFMPKKIDPDTARREVQRGFLTKVYMVLLLQLAFTWGVCLLCMKATGLREFLLDDTSGVPNAAYVIWGCFLLAMGVLIALLFFKNHYPWNGLLLGVFTASMAFIIGVACARYEADGLGHVVLFAWGLTVAIFVSLTLLVTVFPEDWDLSWMGLILFVLLEVLLLVGLTAVIFGVPRGFWYTIPGILIFSGYIVFDSFMIMNKLGPDDWPIACIELYLDILNLFALLLRLLGDR